MLLFEKRLFALEQEFIRVREFLARISESVTNLNPDDENEKVKIKFQLSLATEQAKMVKDLINFFIKLGDKYDNIRILEDITDEIRDYNPDLEEHILINLCEKWQLVMGGDDSEERFSGEDTASDY
ncbi:MAG: hypothetical protein NTY09_12675 [bacterium]|nr:hypothetical protein [bacterium]